ncbi:MAG: glutathione S-transferase family protein [Pseudomonadales bacterium]
MLKLYYFANTCSLAPHIALETAGLEYEAVSVDFRVAEQRTDKYLGINAKGRVPALATAEGIITENPAILMYISQMSPQAKLAPLDNAFAMAQVNSFNAYLSSTVHPAHAHGVRGIRWADDEAAIAEMKRKMPKVMGDCFQLIEDTLFKGPWAMGDDYSICDMYLFTIAQWLEADQVDPARFPKILDHRTRMRDDPIVQKVLAAQ